MPSFGFLRYVLRSVYLYKKKINIKRQAMIKSVHTLGDNIFTCKRL